MSGKFLFLPEDVHVQPHRCDPPPTGNPCEDPLPGRLLVGTVWLCGDLPYGKLCGRRWIVKTTEQMELVWRRRRLPWRPRFGVEYPSAPFFPPPPTEGGPTD